MKSISTTAARFGMLASLGAALSLATPASATPKIYNFQSTGSSGDPAVNFNGDDATLQEGSVAYQDRVHTYRNVPAPLVGLIYLETRNTDKSSATYSLSFDTAEASTIYLFIDNRVGDNDASNPPKLGILALHGAF